MSIDGADIVVIGAGQAGAQAAVSLRNGGLIGRIVLAGDEPWLPYSRPMLSKEYMLGTGEPPGLFLRDREFWAMLGVEFRAGHRAVAIDGDRHVVTFEDGPAIEFRSAVVATGGRARALPVPGYDLGGVCSLRSLADASALRAQVHRATNAVVVGGGYLGLEIASAMTQLGATVTVVEALDALLMRATSAVVSSYFLELHEASGVHVLVGSAVKEFCGGADGMVQAVRLVRGEVLKADVVVVAVGMTPNDELLRSAGAECADGVLVDGKCRTSLPDVYAVGDCARRISEYGPATGPIRLECVQNSVAQAKLAAASILGLPFEPPGAPRFWSNQFSAKFRSVGLSHEYEELEIDGQPASGSFAVSYRRKGRIVARDCVNTLAGYGLLKKDLEERVAAAPADSDVTVRQVDMAQAPLATKVNRARASAASREEH